MIISKQKVEVFENVDQIDVIKDAWHPLYELTPEAHPYLLFEYFRSVLKHFGESNKLRVAVLRNDSKVHSIVPFQLKAKSFKNFNLCYAQVCPDKWPPAYSGILSRSKDHLSVIQQVLAHLVDSDRALSYVLLRNVKAGSALDVPEGSKSSSVRNSRCIRRKVGASVVIRLPEIWEEFLMNLSRNMRKELKYKMNLMAKKHNIKLLCLPYESSTDRDLVKKLIRDSLEIARQSWQGSAVGGKAISDLDTCQFFEEVSLELSKRGALSISVLYADGVPISFNWGVQRLPKVYMLKPGFLPSYSRFSPGKVLDAMLYAKLIEKEVKIVDLGEDSHKHKKHWSKEVVDVYNVYLFPETIKGWLFANLLDLKLTARKLQHIQLKTEKS